jgi:cytochrome c oxidase subunit 2
MSKLRLLVVLLCAVTLIPVYVLAAEEGGLADPAESWELGFRLWFYISFVIWAGVTAALIIFIIKYKKKSPGRNVDGEYIHGNTGLEILWTAVPTVIVILLAAQTWKAFDELRSPPEDAYEINVTGYQFGFDYVYNYNLEGKLLKQPIKLVSNNKDKLVIPEGPVKLILGTRPGDVVHSFYVPEFKTKEDMIPGRKTYIYLLARKEHVGNTYPVYCAEYCGTRHSLMLSNVEVKSKNDFTQWINKQTAAIAEAAQASPVERGEKLVKSQCIGCHNITGAPGGYGPSLKGIFGSKVELEDGTTVTADAAYIKESIRQGGMKVVKGYPKMSNFPPESISDEDVDAIIEYLKTVK